MCEYLWHLTVKLPWVLSQSNVCGLFDSLVKCFMDFGLFDFENGWTFRISQFFSINPSIVLDLGVNFR
jgi:hypothetical protein